MLAARCLAGAPGRRGQDLTQVAAGAADHVLGPDDPFPGDRGGPAGDRLERHLAGDRTVFVSGRERDGVDGYWMVSPLGGERRRRDPRRARLGRRPGGAPATPGGAADLVGYLQPPEGTGAVDDDPDDDVVPQLRTADLVQLVDEDLYGAYVVARDGIAGLPAADLEQLPEPGRFTALRNFLYGVEWWVFGGFAALRVVAVGARRDAPAEPQPPTRDPPIP